METDVTKIKQALLGNWESIAPEVRPSAAKNADGSLKPFYLKRAFKYLPSVRFELEVVNSADPYGAVPLARIKIVGHMLWQGPHPIAPGAQKVDFVADEAYEVTPLAAGFADVLNKVAAAEYAPWAVNATPKSMRAVRCARLLTLTTLGPPDRRSNGISRAVRAKWPR